MKTLIAVFILLSGFAALAQEASLSGRIAPAPNTQEAFLLSASRQCDRVISIIEPELATAARKGDKEAKKKFAHLSAECLEPFKKAGNPSAKK